MKFLKPIGLISLFFVLSSFSAPPAQEEIKWYSFEEAVKLAEKKPKKLLIDVYTNWCGWCKRMDANTFSHPVIAKYVNEHYYAVKLNAERRDTVTFRGRDFTFITDGRRGYHELAVSLMNGKVGYPTIVILDESLSNITPMPGYKDAQSFEPVIKYYGGGYDKTSTWEEFQASFKPEVEPEQPAD